MWHVWFRDMFKWTPRADYLVWWWWQYCATAGPMSDLMSLSALMASLMTALWFNVKHISVFSQMLIWDMISNSEKLGIQMMMTIERTPVAVLTGLLDGFGTDMAHCHWWTEVTCWLLKEIIFYQKYVSSTQWLRQHNCHTTVPVTLRAVAPLARLSHFGPHAFMPHQ